MTYSFLSSLYNYNLDCILYDEENDREIGIFQAREYGERGAESGFVNGGIASGGQSYTIATTDSLIKQADEMRCVVFVEGIKFRIVGKKVKIISPIKGYKSIPKNLEYILVLE